MLLATCEAVPECRLWEIRFSSSVSSPWHVGYYNSGCMRHELAAQRWTSRELWLCSFFFLCGQ